MNENIDLTKILKNCPEDFELYTPLHGKVYFSNINENGKFPIVVKTELLNTISFTKEGYYFIDATNGECLLLPSNEMRDWSKFITPWYKKERFDPKTLKAFDRVIIRNVRDVWTCTLFSHISNKPDARYIYVTCESVHKYCIPYNDETKHLVGTTDEAPDFYKYWED